VLTITAFTMERYVAICRPFRCRASPQLARAVRLVLASWLAAALLAVPPATQFGVVRPRDRLGRDLSECTLKRVTVRHAFLVSTGLFFVAPLCVITVLYVLIGLRLRQSQRPRVAACAPPPPPPQGGRPSVAQGTLSAGAVVARRTSSSSTGTYPGDPAGQARVIRMLGKLFLMNFQKWNFIVRRIPCTTVLILRRTVLRMFDRFNRHRCQSFKLTKLLSDMILHGWFFELGYPVNF